MDILSLIQALVRRWYVTGPVLLIALVVAASLQANTAAQYQANGTLLLEEPEFDPSRLPISVAGIESLAAQVQSELQPSGDAELQLRARDGSAVDLVAVDAEPDQTLQRAREAISVLSNRLEQVQGDAGIPAEESVLLLEPGPVIEPEQLVDGRHQVSLRLELDDPASRVPNPYGAGSATGRLLEVAVSSDAGRRAVAELTDGQVGYSVSISDGIIEVTTLGADPGDVLDAFEPVRQVMAQELERRQDRAEVPRSRHIEIVALAAPESVTDVSPPVSRSVAAVIGLGGLIALVLGIVTESVMSRRRARVPLEVTNDAGWLEGWSDTRLPPPADQGGDGSPVTSERTW